MTAAGALLRLVAIVLFAAALSCDQQIRIGGIFSSPLVVSGVVYFGSADGFLYALE